MLRQTLLPIGEVFPAALFVIRAAVFAKASLFLLFALLPAPTQSAGGRNIQAKRYGQPNHAKHDANGFEQQGAECEQYD
nr:MAG TPA: hypothetical protein [Caudoviricetes sp.]